MSEEIERRTTTWVTWLFCGLLFALLLTPLVAFRPLLFPFVTSKAFLFRIGVELILPGYCFLIITYPEYRPRLKNPLTISLVGFLAVALISAFAGANVTRSIWGNFERMGGVFYFAHLTALYFYILLLAKISETYLQWFLRSLLGVAVIVCLNGFSGLMGGPTLTVDPSLPSRVSSTFGNPIFFASFLIIPFCIALYFVVQESVLWKRLVYAVTALILLWGVFVSGTRGAVVGLIVGALVAAGLTLWLSGPGRLRRTVIIVSGAACALIVLTFFISRGLPAGNLVHRIFNLRDSNSEARVIQWGIAWNGMKDHPLLGVGSENYYVVSNAHNNPTMYQYDGSWFDKPHNYMLEILTTNGWVGLAAYVAMLWFTLWGLVKAYRAGLLSIGELAVLAGGFTAYIFQNLFVFDTVSATVTFYVFCGFVGYCLDSIMRTVPAPSQPTHTSSRNYALLGIGGIIAVGVVYLTNVLPMEASRDINIGYAYAAVNPKKGAEYFASAIHNKFNFDSAQTSFRFSDAIEPIVASKSSGVDAVFVNSAVQTIVDYQLHVAESIKNDPQLWLRAAGDKIYQTLINQEQLSDQQEALIRKGIALAPERTEPLQLLLQYYGYRQQWKEAVGVAEQIARINPYSMQLQVQLASAYAQNGEVDRALPIIDKALAGHYVFTSVNEFGWLVDYYEQQGRYADAAALYEQAIALQPSNVKYYELMAAAYKKAGNNDRAKALYNFLLQAEPERAAYFNEQLKGL